MRNFGKFDSFDRDFDRTVKRGFTGIMIMWFLGLVGVFAFWGAVAWFIWSLVEKIMG